MVILPIKKQWFDMILSGEKKEEYRDIKPYYTKRFQKILAPYYLENGGASEQRWEKDCRETWYRWGCFEVLFRNGYAESSPSFTAVCSLRIGKGKTEWGAAADKDYYILTIKKIRYMEGNVQ